MRNRSQLFQNQSVSQNILMENVPLFIFFLTCENKIKNWPELWISKNIDIWQFVVPYCSMLMYGRIYEKWFQNL